MVSCLKEANLNPSAIQPCCHTANIQPIFHFQIHQKNFILALFPLNYTVIYISPISGVLQNSVLEPLLFILYMADVRDIINSYGLESNHAYMQMTAKFTRPVLPLIQINFMSRRSNHG